MRLLRLGDDGEFSLVEFFGKNVPHYAILSHTWGDDNEEVTFRDLVNGVGKSKVGYSKIRFCGQQAAKDHLRYIWVDTCTIDKSSSAELSEAINSMFRWYHEAAKCYVYLSDVSVGDFARNHLAFRKSRWFTRGWTLQELVAPASVEFFSLEGERLGDKISLMQEIAGITGISIHALHGQHPLHQFSVTERMSWAKGRETKREEDVAYSLLGIFDIHMPLLYGEGREKALIRLHKEIEESLNSKQPFHSLDSATEVAADAIELYKHPISLNNSGTIVQEHQVADAQQKIWDSLRFPQIEERRHQIHEAHNETYRWILSSMPDQCQQWDNLTAWLSSSTVTRRIYWIHGKPGSGKSTMMRFLDENIVTPDHMLPWTENRMVLSARFFFWNAGTKLQKSLTGLLRALLLQLLETQPLLIPQVVNQRKWAAARTTENHPIDWTNADLQHTLYAYILSVQKFATVFLLLDGLDELDGPDDAREELIGLLVNIASLENVKICLSSRPWNIFRDAFREFPQLKLEDLTQNDISTYVKAQLYSHVRFQYILRRDWLSAEELIFKIIQKAAGVFLWVRLVIRELLNGLRDGDGIRMLQKKLNGIPSDLNHYFRSMMDSISPHQSQEASILLQIALYEEQDFDTGHPLRLIDLSFVDEGRPDFILANQHYSTDLDFTDREALEFRLDSTFRRLNSRCMGLLECHYLPYTYGSDEEMDLMVSPPIGELSQGGQDTEIRRGNTSVQVFKLTVDFLHRSCRDFLLTPEIQGFLHQYTQGQYDARMFLLNSRISQFMALATAGTGGEQAVALASNFLSSLARPSYKYTPICTTLATAVQPMLERLIPNQESCASGWYIHPSVFSWRDEQSSFLTLAIDFELSAYVGTHLTSEIIRKKRGRPILDYVLRPRFLEMTEWTNIGNKRPNLELLRVVLNLGANPNEIYGSASVWALFLCFLADLSLEFAENKIYLEYWSALEMLIRAGADALLPKSWLSHESTCEVYSYEGTITLDMSPEERFSCRWPAAVPAMGWNPDLGYEPLYTVSGILESFRPHLRSDVDRLRRLLDSGNAVSI